ncbi:MAG: hypothetical protein KCHDKBKB_00664 [Elusimicrobia bacterium]|nr:hypothetical protein [Elusimicrobiota bacterium]
MIDFDHSQKELAPAMGLYQTIANNVMLEVNRSIKIRKRGAFKPSEVLDEVITHMESRDPRALVYAAYLIGAWAGEQLVLEKYNIRT